MTWFIINQLYGLSRQKSLIPMPWCQLMSIQMSIDVNWCQMMSNQMSIDVKSDELTSIDVNWHLNWHQLTSDLTSFDINWHLNWHQSLNTPFRQPLRTEMQIMQTSNTICLGSMPFWPLPFTLSDFLNFLENFCTVLKIRFQNDPRGVPRHVRWPIFF